MKSHTIKTKYETDILFVGEVPELGKVMLICSYVEGQRIYMRITGNITKFLVDNNQTARKPIALLKCGDHVIEYSSTLNDIDIELPDYGRNTINQEVIKYIGKILEVK